MRIELHVRPGAARPGVGGEHAGRLVVAVHERAVDGRATDAALAAVARALDVPVRRVHLLRGATSRDKLVEIEPRDAAEEQSLLEVVEALRGISRR